jgi:hexosaminidase
MLLVGGNVVVDNDKPHSYVERRGDIALSKGVHEFELTFFENSGGFALKAHVEGPGMARRPLCDDQ